VISRDHNKDFSIHGESFNVCGPDALLVAVKKLNVVTVLYGITITIGNFDRGRFAFLNVSFPIVDPIHVRYY